MGLQIGAPPVRHVYSAARGRGAMSKGPVTRRRMSFTIPFDVVDEIDRYAKRSGAKSRSAAVTDLIRMALASSK